MHKPLNSIFVVVLSVTCLFSTMTQAANKALSLVSPSGSSTISVAAGNYPVAVEPIEIRIDNETSVAGASFTITYDTTKLLLASVGSTFFDTFVNQNLPTPNNQGYVTVDGVAYSSPIVKNLVTTGTMLAAARTNNETGGKKTLFTLNFQYIGGTATLPLTLPVSITQSVIKNPSAGYASTGEAIPVLVGIDPIIPDSYIYYPTLPGPTNIVTIYPCNIVVSALVDNDNDGIEDNWERANVPAGTSPDNALNVFSANRDYDRDGYTDRQEYLNSITGNGRDPSGALYDPKVVNAPGGSGYNTKNKDITPWIYLLLFN